MSISFADTLVMEEIPVEGYEKVIKVTETQSGLLAIISIHSTALGPTLGGTRIYPYASFDDALTDALRLSKGMTYKSAIAECGLGGGKSVIIVDPKIGKTEEMLMAFGAAVDSLAGLYTCAEDVGCNTHDVEVIARSTRYVTGLMQEKSSGNPSYFTAWGVYRGMQAALNTVFGSPSVEGRTVAIQGVGSVGKILADILFWHGAKLIIADINEEKAKEVAKHYSATFCSVDEIWSQQCDVFSPCALGGVINMHTIPKLRCKVIAGAANNQLLTEADGIELFKRGILYAPDYVINAGGLINVNEEITVEGYSSSSSRNKTDKLYDQLTTIFAMAEKNNCSTSQAANELVEYRLANTIGKRMHPPCYHHAK